MRQVCLAGLVLVVLAMSGVQAQAAEKPGSLRHVVCLKFKEGTKPEDIKKAENAFRDLKIKIKEVLSLEWGINVSNEGKDKGFSHCFILTFIDKKDLAVYVKHEEHTAFVKTFLAPILDDAFVLDFNSRE